jgi:hypothetical protein
MPFGVKASLVVVVILAIIFWAVGRTRWWRSPSPSAPEGKRFVLRSDQIKPLATGRGGCIASDLITVEGKKVGYMYREKPDNDSDSGWRFFSGLESQEYTDTPSNFSPYDVNTVANYDHDIIAFLDAPVGSAFERASQSSKLQAIPAGK